jgi:uncharacterized membrane protein YebE (DUF533 family)
VLNNPADVLGIVLRGTLGRSGRKRARRATRFISGHKGFLSASTLIAAAGVAWGIYDSLQGKDQGATGATGASGAMGSVPGVPGVPAVPGAVPPVPGASVPGAAVAAAVDSALDPVGRVVRLAVSAAKADGTLSDEERQLIMDRAKEAGLEGVVEAELNQTRALADIVRGVTDAVMKQELYVLAFTIVRADETVTGAERIYLAQLAHQLGLDAATVATIERDTAAAIDAQPEN